MAWSGDSTMAWSEADQNPSLAPPANSMPTYAQTLNAYAYGSGSSMAPSSPASRGERNYAAELGGGASQQRKATTTSRALQQSAARTQPRAAPSTDGNGYVVQRGDNLTKIGQRFGMSPAEIARANGIRNPNRISAGQRLTIPGGGGGAPRAAASAPGTAPAAGRAPTGGGGYVVQRGDNLTAIARQYGVTVEDIAAANGIRNPNRLSPGQQLTIPGAAPRPEVAMPTPRMRPGPRQMQVDPGRFDDAFAYAPPPAAMAEPFDALTGRGAPRNAGVPTPRMRPSRETIPPDPARFNIDRAMGAIESERLALDAADRRRMMAAEAPQPAYRGAPRSQMPQANDIDTMTMVDENGTYVLPPAGGARPEGPAGGMPAARYRPTVAGRQEFPGALPAARQDIAEQMATLPDRMQYDDLSQSMALARARADARWYRNQQDIMRPPAVRAQPRPVQQPRPSADESTTGTWSDLPDPTPPGYGAQPVDPLASRFGEAFAPTGGGTIMDLRPAFESRAPSNTPPGPPVFVTPSGVRVWAAR